jgi:hypothetical protein
MTRRRSEPPAAGQTDLFGHPTPTPAAPGSGRAVSTVESNDVDLMHTVAANAVRCGYVLIGNAERVYARTSDRGDVARVPRYEEDAVHQLLRRRWLTTGGAQHVTCGALSLRGHAVLVPKDTRSRIRRWEDRQRPPSWPTARAGKERPDPVCAVCRGTGRIPRLDPLVWSDTAGKFVRPRTTSPCHWCQRDTPVSTDTPKERRP